LHKEFAFKPGCAPRLPDIIAEGISGRSLGRSLPWFRHILAYNPHRHARYPAYDFSLRGILKSPNILVGEDEESQLASHNRLVTNTKRSRMIRGRHIPS
jgi:hypothetical protein